VLAHAQGDHAEAQSLFRESLALFRELGDHLGIAQTLNRLGEATGALGDEPEAWSSFLEALRIATQTQTVPVALDALAGLSTLLAREGAVEPALELLAHVLGHSASSQEAKDRAEQLRAELEAQMSSQQIEAAQTRVGARMFDTVVEELLSADRL
jgi:tetratricopeptide (TPR) repeat protein